MNPQKGKHTRTRTMSSSTYAMNARVSHTIWRPCEKSYCRHSLFAAFTAKRNLSNEKCLRCCWLCKNLVRTSMLKWSDLRTALPWGGRTIINCKRILVLNTKILFTNCQQDVRFKRSNIKQFLLNVETKKSSICIVIERSLLEKTMEFWRNLWKYAEPLTNFQKKHVFLP